MELSANDWSQLKGRTAQDLISALKKDGWGQEERRGATIGFVKKRKGSPNLRVVIHYHAKKQYGPRLLRELIKSTEWDRSDLVRLKLIKQKGKR